MTDGTNNPAAEDRVQPGSTSPTQPAEAGSVKRYKMQFDNEDTHDAEDLLRADENGEVEVVVAADYDAVVAELTRERDAGDVDVAMARKERDAALARVKYLESDFLELGKLSDQQTARIAELERDAARYRWLRDWYLRDGKRSEIDPLGHVRALAPFAFDIAIDAAMSPAKEPL